MGHQCLHPHLRRVPPARRPGRRPLRPPPGLPPRHRRLHAQLAAGWSGRQRLDAAGGSGDPRARAPHWQHRARSPSSPPPSPKARQRVRAIGLYTTVSAAGGATGLVPVGCSRSWSRGAGSCSSTCRSGSRSGFIGRVVIGRDGAPARPLRPARCAHVHRRRDRRRVRARRGRFRSDGRVPVTLGALIGGVVVLGATSSTTRAAVRGADPAAPAAGARHPQLGQRGARPLVRRVLRPLLLHGPVPPGRPGLQPAAGRSGVHSDAGLRLPGLAAHQSGPASSPAREGRDDLRAARIAIAGLLLATQVGAESPYSQIVVGLVLIGAGSGMALVPLTSASLADVEPDIAGAASGLVNVSQQLGAAIGLAVLVTVFNSMAGHAQLAPGRPLPHRSTPSTTSSGLRHSLRWVRSRPSSSACAVRPRRRPSLPSGKVREPSSSEVGSSPSTESSSPMVSTEKTGVTSVRLPQSSAREASPQRR